MGCVWVDTNSGSWIGGTWQPWLFISAPAFLAQRHGFFSLLLYLSLIVNAVRIKCPVIWSSISANVDLWGVDASFSSRNSWWSLSHAGVSLSTPGWGRLHVAGYIEQGMGKEISFDIPMARKHITACFVEEEAWWTRAACWVFPVLWSPALGTHCSLIISVHGPVLTSQMAKYNNLEYLVCEWSRPLFVL